MKKNTLLDEGCTDGETTDIKKKMIHDTNWNQEEKRKTWS